MNKTPAYRVMPIKCLVLCLSLLLLTGCTSALGSLFRVLPANTDICPRGHDPFTNQCNQ